MNLNRLACFKSWLLRKDSHSTSRLQPIRKNVRNYHFVVDSKEIWQLIRFAIEISTMSITQFKCRIRLIPSSSFAVFFFHSFEVVVFPYWFAAFFLSFASFEFFFVANFSSSFAENFNINTFFCTLCLSTVKILVSWKLFKKIAWNESQEKRINRRAHIIVCWF